MPLSVYVGRKKYTINLNYYRNWHKFVNNKIKEEYQRLVYDLLPKVKYKKIKLVFTFFPSSKRKIDRSNILSIHEKFFCDALVKAGIIEDDNDSFIESSFYKSGNIDKDDPRVEIEVFEV